MTDQFYPISLSGLLERILDELQSKNEVLGLSKQLFVDPNHFKELKIKRFGETLSSPYGVAAGPHTQLSQNIVSSWLFGARYIELKTIQTLDEFKLSKPCIDMQDEGYNCEWSQELKIQQSFDEYLNAWIIIHILNHKLDWGKSPETIFNMSVGYELQGILQKNVQWFFDKMNNCASELEIKKDQIRSIYPEIDLIDIPTQISNNITLSTMHGCPANEIEDIARYLIEEKKLHTIVKLNPTLLGANDLRSILNDKLAWPVQVPDLAFEHDLNYSDALTIIKNLEKSAQKTGVQFGLKLTNTLEVKNQKSVFDANQEMMYLSGRALHPISINVAAKLQTEFNGRLEISFSGGIDAFNIAEVLDCGIQPITVSSDLLKPGAYSRMAQYAENIQQHLKDNQQNGISEISEKNSASHLKKLQEYAKAVVKNEAYTYQLFEQKNIKTERELNIFDCIAAPCVDTCPTTQNIPEYLHYAAQGDFQKSFDVILKNNAFPQTLGLVCEHTCQSKCTRINYDNPIQIREIKNFVSQQGKDNILNIPKSNGLKIAIIGAGPAGLSAAYFLALEGFKVEIFESEDSAGGLVHKAIPSFRMPNNALYEDIARIESLGVEISYNTIVNQELYNKLKGAYNYVYVAIGAQNMKSLKIPGSDAKMVFDALAFLNDFKNHTVKDQGNNVIVIGGGNTAMDVARAAKKLQKGQGNVTIVYRRSLAQMPADAEEIQDAKTEGIRFLNLLSPLEIIENENGMILRCDPMQLSDKRGTDGRLTIISKNEAPIDIKATAIIPAIGQDVNIPFSDEDILKLSKDSKLLRSGKIFLGGDARHGAASIVQAVGDGQSMAQEIIKIAKLEHHFSFEKSDKKITEQEHLTARAKRIFGEADHKIITTAEQIMEEASRCLSCDDYCNICVSVCPNRANFNYKVKAQTIEMVMLNIKEGKANLNPDQPFEIKQSQQILNIADFCNECGNCTTFCPTAGEPYKDKPHVYLTKESYDANQEGYFFEKLNKENLLSYKNGNQSYSLAETENNYIYFSDLVEVCFNKTDFSLTDITVKDKREQIISLQKAAELRFIMDGAKALKGIC
ncbi:MAG: putative selenate reductase subunit YgfK [Bacteroidales bacterium]|jgi:putative selenate reductase|nr:putative selenate reductase subunit YgfK [Bacteroidales bacterium]